MACKTKHTIDPQNFNQDITQINSKTYNKPSYRHKNYSNITFDIENNKKNYDEIVKKPVKKIWQPQKFGIFGLSYQQAGIISESTYSRNRKL
jgi:hypothetical protein